MSDLTKILEQVQRGEGKGGEQLLPLVYEELRKLATHQMAREAAGHTLQPTALVHEAWLRLVGAPVQNWSGRNHFFMAAAQAMRRILIERARQKSRLKRGGDQERMPLEELELATNADSETLLVIEEALERLASTDPVKARLVLGIQPEATTMPPSASPALPRVSAAASITWAHWPWTIALSQPTWPLAAAVRGPLAAMEMGEAFTTWA